MRRFTATLGLSLFGIVAILGSLASLSLIICVPLFSLENELWDRADNPHTIANVILYSLIGATAIFGARSSDRVRFMLGLGAFLAFIAYGIYDLGLFDD
jgi:membrane associated rhomboid family serine protease